MELGIRWSQDLPEEATQALKTHESNSTELKIKANPPILMCYARVPTFHHELHTSVTICKSF